MDRMCLVHSVPGEWVEDGLLSIDNLAPEGNPPVDQRASVLVSDLVPDDN